MAAAAGDETLHFVNMSEVELRQWVEANPGRVNHRDRNGLTPLTAAAWNHTRSLVVWLLDEKGADVNATTTEGNTALHCASRPDVITALLDRGADPGRVNRMKWSPLMRQALYGSVEVVARLLQDPRVRATVNMQDKEAQPFILPACQWPLELRPQLKQ